MLRWREHMRFGTFIAGAIGIAVIGYFAFRILDLEQRVALLSEQAGTRAAASSSAAGRSLSAGPVGALDKALDERLAAVERRLDSLAKQLSEKRGPAISDLGKSPTAQEEAILSVVERETSRIRDVQLEWQRTRWLETREQQLSSLATSMQLDAAQTTALRTALEREADDLIAVLRKPTFAEDPDQAVSEWKAALNTADNQALAVLKPEQQAVWLQLRHFERNALWPWLPK
jgi:hypothetical protein